jgi:hypothetical protein
MGLNSWSSCSVGGCPPSRIASTVRSQQRQPQGAAEIRRVNLFGGCEVLHLCELTALKHPLPRVRFWAVAQ